MSKPRFLLSLTRKIFDVCYDSSDQQELQSLVELVGGIPSRTEYISGWLLKNIKEVEACITGWGSISLDDELLDKAKRLKILFHTAGSVRDLYDKAIKRKIRMVSNAAINAIPVAEFALGAILSGLKGVYHYQEQFRKEGRIAWKQDISISPGYYRTTVGIISLGHIGRKLLKLLQNFDFNLLVYSKHLSEREANRLNVKKASLNELMSHSDAIVLCVPDLPENRHMVNAEHFALMKDNALFINVARGALIDEADLVNELKKGRITAFLDVTEPEPPEEGHPFYTLPNCILTPHIAGSFGNECYRLGKATLDEVKRYLKGEPLKNELSLGEFFYRA
ncbi:MAG: hydroxyacid dehydrogenase [Clostridia bacterium]|jgi:phosphoglycerate dehydrogenase-like enzyme|nr:hydroxyacid dehydrogenase [Clostridia bacterium]